MNDLKSAIRQLFKNPGFCAVAVLTLALGIGATSAVFNLIQGVLLTPPPYPKSEQVILISPAKMQGKSATVSPSSGQWTEWQEQARSFEAMAGYDWTFDYLILPDGSEAVEGLQVTSDYFKVLGIGPLFGRTFLDVEVPTDHQTATTVILGYDLWQRRFNGNTNVLGQGIRLSRHQPLTVVGVMPPGIRFLPSFGEEMNPNYDVNAKVDYWLPVRPDLGQPKQGAVHGPWSVAGRLREGVTLRQAQAELAAIAAKQAQADHDYEGLTVTAQPLAAFLNREGHRLLLPLLGAVGMVFLIACGNVAGLLLARGLQRQQEYAVRGALGAPRFRLFRQVLIESLTLAFLGGALGAVLANGIVNVLKVIGGFAIPRLDAVTFGWPVWAFCFGAAVMAAAMAGLAPALRASRLDPAQAMKGNGPTSSAGRGERRLLAAVAVLQTSLTLALLMGAGLLIRTVHNLAKVRPGFDTQKILTMSVMTDYDKIYDFHTRALDRISALPGVKNAAFVWGLPLTGNKFDFDPGLRIEGAAETSKLAEKPSAAMRAVTPAYFDALGIPIVAGRGFRGSDNWESWTNVFNPAPGDPPFVCIINQAMADKYFQNVSPIGKKLWCAPWPKRPKEIVGVVANTRTEALTQEEIEPEIYLPFFQVPVFTKHLVVQTASAPRSLMSAVQRELRAINPAVAIEHVKSFDEIRRDSTASPTFAMRLLVGFSVVACVLALVGIYGVLSLSVSSRRREIAVRTAVGAQRRDILGLVLREGFQLVAIGLIGGVVMAIALARVLGTWLFGVESTDPLTLLAVTVGFGGVALAACWLPAHRAVEVDPMEALRHE